jgi:hypothetical protein
MGKTPILLLSLSCALLLASACATVKETEHRDPPVASGDPGSLASIPAPLPATPGTEHERALERAKLLKLGLHPLSMLHVKEYCTEERRMGELFLPDWLLKRCPTDPEKPVENYETEDREEGVFLLVLRLLCKDAEALYVRPIQVAPVAWQVLDVPDGKRTQGSQKPNLEGVARIVLEGKLPLRVRFTVGTQTIERTFAVPEDDASLEDIDVHSYLQTVEDSPYRLEIPASRCEKERIK